MAKNAEPKKLKAPRGTFDRRAYQRQYMREWRIRKRQQKGKDNEQKNDDGPRA